MIPNLILELAYIDDVVDELLQALMTGSSGLLGVKSVRHIISP